MSLKNTSLCLLEVKPLDDSINLDDLAAQIFKMTFEGNSAQWKSDFKKEPVAFGIFKLILGCILPSSYNTDEFTDAICDQFPEEIQSVDVLSFNEIIVLDTAEEMQDYGDADYWDERYTKRDEQTFEWILGWKDLKSHIEALFTENQLKNKSEISIMNLGCGNSVLSEDMYDEGYKQIFNMDISQVCIDHMTERNAVSRPEMKWEVMDVRSLSYTDE